MMEPSKSESINFFTKSLAVGYLLIVFFGLFNTFVIKAGVYNIETFSGSSDRFRLAQTVDVIMYCVVIWVSCSSFMLTKSINKGVSLLGFLFRFGEGLLGFVAVIISMMVVIILANPERWEAFNLGQTRALAIMFMDLNNLTWDILFILMGIGATIFMYLFYVSRYIPRWLSIWGMFTYISMFTVGVIKLLFADVPEKVMVAMFPGMLFELTFGVWLITKGLKIQAQPSNS